MRILATIALAWGLAAPCAAWAQTPAPAADPELVVTGTRDKMSGWREAETDHVVVISDGSESELVRIAHNLERLHFLLSMLLGRVDKPDDTIKLRVTLVGDAAEFETMDLKNLRSSPGPYPAAFPVARYYDPREDGAVLAASRYDQKALLEPGQMLAGLLPDLVRMTSAQSGMPTPGVQPLQPGAASALAGSYAGAMTSFARNDPLSFNANEVSVPIPAEGRVYAGFAQHYLLTYFPAAYPRWYVDGFGEVFSTIAARSDGRLEYGRGPKGYTRVLDHYMRYPVADVLTGRYLEDKRARERWTPFHNWALTHMLFFTDARRSQLRAYLAAIARGTDMAEAAKAFGDLDQLQRELSGYDNRKIAYEEMTYPAERAGEPIVRRLTEGQAAFVKGRLELGARTAIPPESLEPKLAKARADAIAGRDRWLSRLRRDAGRYPTNLEAQLLLAEAECRSGNGGACVAAADRALGIAPGNSAALAWKGSGEVQLALAGPASDRSALLKNARRDIAKANRANTDSPLPLLAYYRSFADAGQTPPDAAIEGLMKVTDTVPAAPGPRLMLGEALKKRGIDEAARQALLPVANGAYETPERAEARAVLETLGG